MGRSHGRFAPVSGAAKHDRTMTSWRVLRTTRLGEGYPLARRRRRSTSQLSRGSCGGPGRHGHGAGADSADSDARVRLGVPPVSRHRGSDRHVPSCRVTVSSLAMGTRRGHMALGRPHAQRASAGCCASVVAGHGRPAPITVVWIRAGGLNKGRMPVRPAHVAAARLQAGPRCPPKRLPVKRGRRRSRAVCGVPSLGGLKMHVPKIGRNVSSK